MKSIVLAASALVSLVVAAGPAPAADSPRPNVLWLIAEDLGVDLGCYGNPLARTPNLDKLAADGVRYPLAFTTAPVCSASRSAFMTGMYQTSIGAHHHRSHRNDGTQLPEGVLLLTDHFRQAGYFTANVRTAAPGVTGTCKTDFNFTAEKPFDGTDWNQRAAGQPFYAQVNFTETHRTFKKLAENPTDPAKVVLPPFYPDHPVAREDWALYLDSLAQLDQKVGAVLKRLDDEGLADSTIVFFFGDNGVAHARGKQFCYDGGLHVPLIVRIPPRYRPASQGQPGTVYNELVSAIDFGVTSLELAGLPRPAKTEGRTFFGPQVEPRPYIVGARDRCDETMDRIRTIRTKEFSYLRNFYPERPYMQPNAYKERQYPVWNLLKELGGEGKLTPAQALFVAPTRPPEELYDLKADPYEIHNLAGDPQYRDTLLKLRATLDQWICQTGDQGQVPEDPAIAESWRKAEKDRAKAKVQGKRAAKH